MSPTQLPLRIPGPSPRVRPASPDTVNTSLTAHRRRVVENDEYAAFVRRVLRACARRVAAGDIEAITCMAALADELDEALRSAVAGLRSNGYSWAEIGARLNVTRQAAQQRWGAGSVSSRPAATPPASRGDAA
jgi:hypothetical protein